MLSFILFPVLLLGIVITFVAAFVWAKKGSRAQRILISVASASIVLLGMWTVGRYNRAATVSTSPTVVPLNFDGNHHTNAYADFGIPHQS